MSKVCPRFDPNEASCKRCMEVIKHTLKHSHPKEITIHFHPEHGITITDEVTFTLLVKSKGFKIDECSIFCG